MLHFLSVWILLQHEMSCIIINSLCSASRSLGESDCHYGQALNGSSGASEEKYCFFDVVTRHWFQPVKYQYWTSQNAFCLFFFAPCSIISHLQIFACRFTPRRSEGSFVYASSRSWSPQISFHWRPQLHERTADACCVPLHDVKCPGALIQTGMCALYEHKKKYKYNQKN